MDRHLVQVRPWRLPNAGREEAILGYAQEGFGAELREHGDRESLGFMVLVVAKAYGKSLKFVPLSALSQFAFASSPLQEPVHRLIFPYHPG